MSVPEPAPVVIACPHCGTRYQVAYAAIGAEGRTVACAHCGKSWEAHAPRPPRQKDFEELAEEALDEKMVAEERRHQARREASFRAEAAAREARARARAGADAASAEADADHQRTLDELRAAVAPMEPAPAAAPDPAMHKRRQREFSQRQQSVHSKLPIARMRRLARIAALAAFVLVLGGGVLARGALVGQFPGLAGSYAALGLPVNVVGLDFDDVKTLKSLQQGAEVLVVDGKIRSVAGYEVALPQVIVTLLGPAGDSLYEWSVAPKATELEPGEEVAFETQLTMPPAGATAVKLSFATARLQSKAGPGDAVAADTAPDAPVPTGSNTTLEGEN